MRRILAGVAVTLLVVFGLVAVWIHDLTTSLVAERVTDDVHVLFGAGGNVGVLATRERAEELGHGPVQALLNTHHHLDHTHGNPAFAPGMRIVAAERALDYLKHFDADYWTDGAEERLPNELVSDVSELSIGNKTIRAHHLGRGHTGGDLVVLFVEDRVVHTGDLFFHARYPRIDLEAGGSVPAWIATLDRVLELEFDRVIPGHGAVTDRSAVEGFQRFLSEVWQVAQSAAAQGLTQEEMLATASLTSDAGYAPGGLPPFVTFERDDVLRQAWDEATGSVSALEVPVAEVP
jgi:glyoxylase-like metal-dependent hydrolase (beta-lactamase superfamily II)